MKLQLALDLVNIPEAIEVVREVQDHIDVVEIGTPVVINEGLRVLKEGKEAFLNLTVLADLKIMDAAGYEVMKASEAGADIVTILGATQRMQQLKAPLKEWKKLGKQILVDMVAVKDLKGRAQELDALGVDYICVHTGYDLQAKGQNPFEALRIIKSVVKNAKQQLQVESNLKHFLKLFKQIQILSLLAVVLQAKTTKKLLQRTAELISDNETEELVNGILESKKVFVAGTGRSGFMGKSFAM
jgi:3-hexulose-6-phosphate synthase